MEIHQIGILGTGTIGACLATLTIGNGIPTVVIGHSQAGMLRCRDYIIQNLDELIAGGSIQEENKQAALRLLTITGDWNALHTVDAVFEAVKEDLEIKLAVLKKLEEKVSPQVPVLSCTSAFLPEQLAEKSSHPQRILVAHPFQPAHLQPLVELVGHEQAEPGLFDEVAKFLEKDLARKVVRMRRAVPGFIVNRIAQAMFRESIFLMEQGVATAEDIDKAVRYAVGQRYSSIGLLEYFDDVGFQLEADIAKTVYPTLCNTSEVQSSVLAGIADGRTGLKAGHGFYEWTPREIADYHRRKIDALLKQVKWNLPTQQ